MELQGLALEIGQRIAVPIVNDTLLDKSVKTSYLSHNRLDVLI